MSTCIHIGLMKTGSTFFQTRIFPNLKGVNYVHGMESFYKGRFFSFGAFKPLIISNEGITGSWYKDDECGLDYFERFCYTIDNIQTYFNAPKIRVVFREPSSFIYSSYKQYLHEGGVKNWEEFFPLDRLDETFLDQFKFSKFIERLQDKFPKDQLLMLDFQDIIQNPEQLFEDVKKFCLSEETYKENKDLRFDNSRRSNPALQTEYENVVILSNRINKFLKKNFGFMLKIKLGRIEISLTTFIRYFLPRKQQKKEVKYIAELKNYYSADWTIAQQMMKSHAK